MRRRVMICVALLAAVGSADAQPRPPETRQSAPGAANDARYREIQTVYESAPSAVYLAFLHHTYASRSDGWTYEAPILEPHSHGVAWGPWWNLPSWTSDAP